MEQTWGRAESSAASSKLPFESVGGGDVICCVGGGMGCYLQVYPTLSTFSQDVREQGREAANRGSDGGDSWSSLSSLRLWPVVLAFPVLSSHVPWSTTYLIQHLDLPSPVSCSSKTQKGADIVSAGTPARIASKTPTAG